MYKNLMLSFAAALIFTACNNSTSEEIDVTNPIITSVSEINVDENQTTVLTVQATDASTLTYSISGTDANSFNINSSTGVISFKTAPDYETKSLYQIVVEVKDNMGNSVTQNLNVNINDVDDFGPVFTSSSQITVDEKQTSAFTAIATDDTGPITYAISGTDANSFNINSTSGVITFKTAPDDEVQNSYSIVLTASDSLGNSTNQNVTISIANVDSDQTAPVITSSNSISVDENQTSALTVVATDASNSITYSISGTDANSFNIDSSTGILTFKTAPDYETKSSYSITVTATDNSSNSTEQNITISINDLDEIAPVITSSNSVSVDENQTSALTVVATDASNSITYSISGTDANSFNIDSSTGVLTFKSAPDYETKSSYSITATATDNASNSTDQNITITLIDLDGPIFTSSDSVNADENQTSALTLSASDSSGPIVYSISGTDESSFDIDSSTGVITFKSAPDYETKSSYLITATATDNLSNATNQNITISINNLEDIAPEISTSSPENNNVNIAVDANLTVTFSESMDETTISNQNITLEKNINEELLQITVTYDDGTKTATINPDNDLVDGVFYKLTITTNVKDASNNALSQETEINFMVGDGIVHNGLAYKNISSPITGKIWLDRNLGASRACLTSTDEQCYGDLYQWGRKTDGHEKTTSNVTAARATDIIAVGHGDFITSVQSAEYDWAPGDIDGAIRVINWGNTTGTFLCPVGYRVPTDTELKNETTDNTGPDNESTGDVIVVDGSSAFKNFLKLPLAGFRDFGTGEHSSKDSIGFVWTRSTANNNVSTNIYYGGSTANSDETSYRANGFSVRCIKE